MAPPPAFRRIDLRGAAVALLVSMLWGASPVAIKIGLEDVPPFRMAWMRFVVGGVVVLVWAWLTGRLARFGVAPGEWRPLLVLGLLFTAQISAMNLGTSLTSAAHATILLNLYAVHTVVLAHFMIPGDRLTARKLGGILIAYSGILVLFAREISGGSATLLGDAIMVVSSLVLAERTIYLVRAVQSLEPVKLLLAQIVVGTPLFVLLSLAVESSQPTHWTGRLVAAIAYQGVVIAGFNFIINLWLLKHYRPSTMAGFFLTQPIFGIVAAALLAGDTLTAELLYASIAVTIGIALTIR